MDESKPENGMLSLCFLIPISQHQIQQLSNKPIYRTEDMLQVLPIQTENDEMKVEEEDDGDGLIPLPIDESANNTDIPIHEENDTEMKDASEAMNIDAPQPLPPTNTDKEEVVEEEEEDGGEIVEEEEDGEGGGIIEVEEEEEDGGEVQPIPQPLPPPPPTNNTEKSVESAISPNQPKPQPKAKEDGKEEEKDKDRPRFHPITTNDSV